MTITWLAAQTGPPTPERLLLISTGSTMRVPGGTLS
jgi:hypothetical protein